MIGILWFLLNFMVFYSSIIILYFYGKTDSIIFLSSEGKEGVYTGRAMKILESIYHLVQAI